MAPRPRETLLRPRVGAGLFLFCLVVAERDSSWSSADIEAFEDSEVRLQLLQLQLDLDRAPNDQDPSIVVVPPRPHKFPSDETARMEEQAFIPTSAFLLGAMLLAAGHRTPGMLATYFAGQSSFALYMKLVLSEETVSRELNLRGMPAAFLVTAIQQVVAFFSLALVMSLLYFSPYRYIPRKLKSWNEVLAVLFFSAAVAVNIGLNNFSMSLLPVSLNLVIRSCIPLVTLMLQQLAKQFNLLSANQVGVLDVSLMVGGVVCAAVSALAESANSENGPAPHLMLGVLMCSLGDIAAAMTLILASAFGNTLDPPLNPLDTIFYMALPCALTLLPASLYASHPVDWPNFGVLTDWEVYQKVHVLNPGTIFLVIASGIVSAGYNFIQYTVVQTLSASHAAFAGNFNKAATISLSICLGLETLPGGKWKYIMLLGIVGNILAFTTWSYLQAKLKEKTQEGKSPS
ncbi:unnamed protein product [Symbiodinium pilosum]|uniref:Sugar phosphate transporter domain-containing protein n=1 Tax=Symbiodinium pilosum TaxID=2952 RepID=A0A812X1R6_SYMPI|nr:unnamed protein product [Symbiodinium pilosum]